MLDTLFPTLPISELAFVVILVAAVLTSVVHGASGIAGGFLMAAVLVQIIDIKDVMPVLSVTLLITGLSRSFLGVRSIDWHVLATLIVPAVPAVFLVGSFYGSFSGSFIAALMGVMLISSLILRRIADRLKFKVGLTGIGLVGGAWGALTGASIGPGLLVLPFLINYGLRRETLVITMSAAAIFVHVFRIAAYTNAQQLTVELATLGAIIGMISLPGNWIGRMVLRRISDGRHIFCLEVLLVLGALNFFAVALR